MEATMGLTRPFSYGRGWPRLVRIADPAAGAVVTHTVPGDRLQRVVIAHALLETSEAEVTRGPILRFNDPDGNAVGRFGPTGEVAKSSTQRTTWAAGLGYRAAANTDGAQCSIPDVFLVPGMQIVFGVNNIDEGDQQSDVTLYLEEWPNGPDGYPTGVQSSVVSALLG